MREGLALLEHGGGGRALRPVYRFADKASCDAALGWDEFRALVADFSRAWPEGVTRTRDVVTVAEERDRLALGRRGGRIGDRPDRRRRGPGKQRDVSAERRNGACRSRALSAPRRACVIAVPVYSRHPGARLRGWLSRPHKREGIYELSLFSAAQAGQGGPVSIACINKATRRPRRALGKLTAALQKCYDRHFLPVWGYPVKLYNTKTPSRPTGSSSISTTPKTPGVSAITISPRGAAAHQGLRQDHARGQRAGQRHRLPRIVRDGDRPDRQSLGGGEDGTEYAYEMCDPVEEDTFLVDGIQMSNFVYPAWFEPFKHPPGTKFDHLGLLKKPFTLTKGGYVIVKKNGKVSEEFGSQGEGQAIRQENRRGHRSEYRKAKGLRIKPAPADFIP